MTLAERMHPFTLGTVMLGSVALALLLPETWSVWTVCGVLGVTAIATGSGRAVRLALLGIAPIWLLLFLMQVLMGLPPREPAPWGGSISISGLAWALSQGGRLALILVASLLFATGFDPHRFLQAAIARRWPFGAAFLLVATLDAAHQLGVRAGQLREAQRTRGVRVQGSIRQRIHAVPALVFPLLLSSLTEADDRALALETRGMLLRTARTATDPPIDRRIDRIVRWTVLCGVLALCVYRLVS